MVEILFDEKKKEVTYLIGRIIKKRASQSPEIPTQMLEKAVHYLLFVM